MHASAILPLNVRSTASSLLRTSELHASPAAVAGGVRWTLRIEGLAVLAAAIALYARTGASAGLFAALFLVPDLSMVGYLAGPRVGALVYNAAHSLIGAIALGLVALLAAPWAAPYALIWLSHIGFDRAAGYGLKYATAFGDTHLGRVGRASR